MKRFGRGLGMRVGFGGSSSGVLLATITHHGTGTDPLDCHVVGESAAGDCTTFAENEELEFHAAPEGGSTFETPNNFSALAINVIDGETGADETPQHGLSLSSNPTGRPTRGCSRTRAFRLWTAFAPTATPPAACAVLERGGAASLQQQERGAGDGSRHTYAGGHERVS